MTLFKKIAARMAVAGLWASLAATGAFAQNRDWASPITDKVTLLSTGLQAVAVGLAIVGIMIAGFGYIVQNRVDVQKVVAVLVGAVLSTGASVLVPAFFN